MSWQDCWLKNMAWSMLNKITALILSCILIVPGLAYADPPNPEVPPQPQIKSIAKGDSAPFSGVLLNPTAAAKIFTERDFLNEECVLKISYAVEKESLRLKLLLDSSQASLDSMEQKYTSLLNIKDQEIKRLSKVASEKGDYSSWWFAGGVVAGIITSVAIVYAVNKVN